ncbi:MAG: radical SAM protein [Rhodomicrobium sp.]
MSPFPKKISAGLVSFRVGTTKYAFSPQTGKIFQWMASSERDGETIPFGFPDAYDEGTSSSLNIRTIQPGFSFEEVQKAIQHDLGHISFGVTQDCNLRCSYCVFGGEFKHYRTHSSQVMTEDVALKAADYFLEHLSARKKMVFTTFYGGEPFLNLPVIKTVQAYLKKALGERIFFSITTNGTLLNADARSFVAENRIHLCVSVDGDKETHNRNRKLANGRPTFETIMRNLECLREAESYFDQFVSFGVTITAGCDYKCLDDFFANYRNAIRVTPVMYYGSKNIPQTRGATANLSYLINKFTEGCITHAFDDPERRWKYQFAFAVLGRGLRMLHNRKVSDTPLFDDTYYHVRHCIPGASKLFVSANGTFFPCERLDSYSHLAIGNVEHGVCPHSSYNLMLEYLDLRDTYCKDCYLIDICDYCIQSASNGSGWDPQKMQIHCELARADFLGVLRLYTSILERDANAFDFIDDFRVEDTQEAYLVQ